MPSPPTLRASLSGTILQTLPELLTPLSISAQVSADAVTAIRKVWVLITLWKQYSVKHARKLEARPPRVKKKKKKRKKKKSYVWIEVNLVLFVLT